MSKAYLEDFILPNFRERIIFPENVESKGGKGLPVLSETNADSAPQIAEITDLTYPDESFSMSGEGLADASLLLWSEGGLQEIEPLRSEENKLQAVVPKDAPKSVMIVWPKNSNGIGYPIRVNAPAIWFSNKEVIETNVEEREIRFFGKGLFIENEIPSVVYKHEGVVKIAEIIDINPYQVTVRLKDCIGENEKCEFYFHNGTGGIYGWSQPFSLLAKNKKKKIENKLPVIYVDDFGAVPNDGKDDIDAINEAVKKAAELGGAVIQFGCGEYNVSKTIEIKDNFPYGLYFKGVGEGDYDFKSKLLPKEYDCRGVSGNYTSLRFLNKDCVPENIIRVKCNDVTISDMTIFGSDGVAEGYSMWYGFTMELSGQNINVCRVRMIKSDLRDFNFNPNARLMCSNHIYVDKASKNINILCCEFHTKACAIWVNRYEEGTDQFDLFDDNTQVKYLNICDCKFYGYTHPYVHPDGRKPIADEGEISRGITMMNCVNSTIERCYFKGFDQENGFILCRSMLFVITSNCIYISENRLEDIGCTPMTKFDGNTGEQMLFHGGLHFGGVYNVYGSSENSLVVRTDNIRLKDEEGNYIRSDKSLANDGSRINEYLTKGTRGMAFVCAGKGVGQIREVTDYKIQNDKITFNISDPWRIKPDETSIVVETAPFRQNIIYKNEILKSKPTLAEDYKSGGVLFFFDSHSNIIAENNISNLSFGIVFNTAFKAPSSWNIVRDNKLSGITEAYKDARQGGDTTRNATFFCESVIGNIQGTNSGGWDNYNVWYTAGNTFRNNKCVNGDTAAELATNRWHHLFNKGIEKYYGQDKGNSLTVIENNKFEKVADGILVGNPDYWSLIRNNEFSFKVKDGYEGKEIINEQPLSNFKLLYIDKSSIEKKFD